MTTITAGTPPVDGRDDASGGGPIASRVAPPAPTSTRGVLLAGYGLLLFGLLGFVAWAVIMPLASAVIGPGVVKVDSSRKEVQHLEGGVVKELLVRDGDTVRGGDVVIRLDSTRAASSLGVLESSYFSALAQHARLNAERQEKEVLGFPEELTRRADDPRVQEVMAAQQSLFGARRSSLEGQIRIVDQQIANLEQEIVGLQAQLAAKERQIGIAKGEVGDLRKLLERGMAERTRVLAIERELAELEGRRGEHVSAIAAAKSRIAEKELQKFQLRKAFHEEVVGDLRQVQTEVFDLADRIQAARHTLEHTDIRAPVDGTVVDLRAHTVGGVIGPGSTVLEIVPTQDRLIIEARINPKDIDVVQTGQDAGVKLTAFKQRTTPELNGRVTYVSADALEDRKTGEPYFLARIEVPEYELARLEEGKKAQPGMMAEVYIRTGEKTAAEYLIQPLLDSVRRAWREE
jgi:HlyD family type I secretion membrane fusion protein